MNNPHLFPDFVPNHPQICIPHFYNGISVGDNTMPSANTLYEL